MRQLPEASVHAVVTDPPYGINFMGKAWDAPGGILGQMATGDEQRGYADNDNAAFGAWCETWLTECLRVLKPGGHLLAFGGTRTWHRLACAVEDAGFEIRDSIAWLYGSGFPKSLDVSKAIDRQRHDRDDVRRATAWIATARATAGITNRDIDAAFGFNGMAGHWTTQGAQAAIPTLDQVPTLLAVLGIDADDVPDEIRALLIDLNGMKGQPGPAWFAREITQAEARPLVSGETISFDQRSSKERERRDIPATPDAERWQGWGTALKPSFEGIVCATKPVPALAGGSRAAFEPVVVARKPLIGTVAANVLAHGTGALNIDGCRIEHGGNIANADGGGQGAGYEAHNKPARIYGKGLGGIVAEPHTSGRWPANVVLDESQAGALDEQSGTQRDGVAVKRNGRTEAEGWGNIGKAAVGTPDETYGGQAGASRFFYVAKADASERPRANGTAHPTVKPLDLMRWLVRLVTPPGGIVLEPFAGSGTTVEACIKEDVRCVAIEREADYLPLIDERINRNNLSLFAGGAS